MCSEEYIKNEIEHIVSTFKRLKYPLGFILKQKQKAIIIKKNNRNAVSNKKTERYITVPNSKLADIMTQNLRRSEITISFSSGKKIQDIISSNKDDIKRYANKKV